jgi:hypothetical protein
MSFPSSPASGWTKSCMGTRPPLAKALIPALIATGLAGFPLAPTLSGSHPQLLATCHTLSGRWQHFNGKATDLQAVANGFKVSWELCHISKRG